MPPAVARPWASSLVAPAAAAVAATAAAAAATTVTAAAAAAAAAVPAAAATRSRPVFTRPGFSDSTECRSWVAREGDSGQLRQDRQCGSGGLVHTLPRDRTTRPTHVLTITAGLENATLLTPRNKRSATFRFGISGAISDP